MPSGRSGSVPVAACNSVSVTSDTSSIPAVSESPIFIPVSQSTGRSHFTALTPVVVLVHNLLLHLHHFHLWPLRFPFLDNRSPSAAPRSLSRPFRNQALKQTHLVLVLLLPAVAVVALGIGFHDHGGEEVLHGVVAQIVTDRAEL